MNPPQLPASRAVLALLASSVLAAPALAAPDFEAMRDCDPALYKKFSVMKNLAESQSPEMIKSKLPKLHEMLSGLTSSTDELLWPLKDAGALPAACPRDDGRIKDEIYGGLAELRKLIDDKVKSTLPEEERSPSQDLTAKERAVDALMGDRSKTLVEFKAALSGLKGGGDGPESLQPRAEKLAARLKDIQKRVAEGEKAGAASLGGFSMPESVRERQAKDAAASKQRTGGMMGIDFGAQKRDDSPNPPAAAAAPAPGAGRPDGGAPADSTRKTPRPRGADLVDRAEIGHGADPDEAAPGAAAGAVKNSATKPLGGAISPPSADDAASYLARKAAAKTAAESILNMKNGREKAEAEMEANEARGFAVDVSIKNGAGFLTLNKGGRGRRFEIVNGKLPNIPLGDITPEEEGVLAAELEAATRKRAD